jgi:hypothetical protein
MKMLEARFHPTPRPSPGGQAYIVVGHVIVEADGTTVATRVKPCGSLVRQCAPATLLATLRHLARITAPRCWERLQALRNRHWSFVPLEPVVVHGDAEPAFLDEA